MFFLYKIKRTVRENMKNKYTNSTLFIRSKQYKTLTAVNLPVKQHQTVNISLQNRNLLMHSEIIVPSVK